MGKGNGRATPSPPHREGNGGKEGKKGKKEKKGPRGGSGGAMGKIFRWGEGSSFPEKNAAAFPDLQKRGPHFEKNGRPLEKKGGPRLKNLPGREKKTLPLPEKEDLMIPLSCHHGPKGRNRAAGCRGMVFLMRNGKGNGRTRGSSRNGKGGPFGPLSSLSFAPPSPDPFQGTRRSAPDQLAIAMIAGVQDVITMHAIDANVKMVPLRYPIFRTKYLHPLRGIIIGPRKTKASNAMDNATICDCPPSPSLPQSRLSSLGRKA